MAVAGAALHFSVSCHGQEVPTVVIALLHVPAIRSELRIPHGPIRQVDTAAHSLHLAQPPRVPVAVHVTSRERFWDEAARWSQQDQLVANTITESLRKGQTRFSSCTTWRRSVIVFAT